MESPNHLIHDLLFSLTHLLPHRTPLKIHEEEMKNPNPSSPALIQTHPKSTSKLLNLHPYNKFKMQYNNKHQYTARSIADFFFYQKPKIKNKNSRILKSLTTILLPDLLPPPLPIPGPLGDAAASLHVGLALGHPRHDLDPEDAVGEDVVVESERVVAVVRSEGSLGSGGVIGVHDRLGIEKIRASFLHPLQTLKVYQSIKDDRRGKKREEIEQKKETQNPNPNPRFEMMKWEEKKSVRPKP